MCIFSIFAQFVQAEEIAWAGNTSGGKIVLTNEVCWMNGKKYPKFYRSFTYTSTGQTMNSCFILDGTTVLVIYTDGTEYRYPIVNFEVKGNSL